MLGKGRQEGYKITESGLWNHPSQQTLLLRTFTYQFEGLQFVSFTGQHNEWKNRKRPERTDSGEDQGMIKCDTKDPEWVIYWNLQEHWTGLNKLLSWKRVGTYVNGCFTEGKFAEDSGQCCKRTSQHCTTAPHRLCFSENERIATPCKPYVLQFF